MVVHLIWDQEVAGSNPVIQISVACAGVAREIKLISYGEKSESEGVLMIIVIYAIIVFQLVERIAIVEKSSTEVLRKCICMLGFSYNALPTRHEVPRKPYLQEDKL